MIAALCLLSLQTAPQLEWVQVLTPASPLSFATGVEAGNDGASGLLTVGRDGTVRTYTAGADSPFAESPLGDLVLPAPNRTLIDFERVAGGDAPLELVALAPDGCRAYPVDPLGVVGSEGRVLARRARFELRLGAPQRSDFLSDVDGDGRLDLIEPGLGQVSLWELPSSDPDAEPGAPRPGARRRLTVASPVEVFTATERDDLTDTMVSRLRLPGLRTEDVNGDGRPDLLVFDGTRRAFYLARAVGGLPTEPDVTVDLELFRDRTVEGSGFEFGQALSLGGDADLRQRDLDGDGIQDHVIVAGHKVWVFPSTADGPQFTEPSTILRSADVITVSLLLPIDDDALPELILLQLKVPSVTTLVLGLVSSFDVELRASGYRNLGAGQFEKTPAWNTKVRLRLPSILSVVRNSSELVERVRAAARSFRPILAGDFNGDGNPDAAVEDSEGTGLELWLGADAAASDLDRGDLDRSMRDLLFGEAAPVWTIDRVIALIEAEGGGSAERVTAGAERAGFLAYPDSGTRVGELVACDPSGDGRDVIVVSLLDQNGRTQLHVGELGSR